MSDVITFANEILKTDPFMYTLKLGLPELISGRQFVAPAKETSYTDEQVHQEYSKKCLLLLILF